MTQGTRGTPEPTRNKLKSENLGGRRTSRITNPPRLYPAPKGHPLCKGKFRGQTARGVAARDRKLSTADLAPKSPLWSGRKYASVS